jgi:hypothetical protein
MSSFMDISDLYANRYETVIKFTHVWSGETISFKAFLTAYSDDYKTEWNSEQVFGRNDPIQTFKNTTRTINIGWDVPAADFNEAGKNMNKASKLVKFLYPNYRKTGEVQTIAKPPLVRVSFMNLIQGTNPTGLLCTMDGISFSPDLEAGWFDSISDFFAESNKGLYPKLLNFSANLVILHEETLRWDEENQWGADENFPFLPQGTYFSDEAYLNNFDSSGKFPPLAGAFNNQQLTDVSANQLSENQSQNISDQASQKKRISFGRQTRKAIEASGEEFKQSDSSEIEINQEASQGSNTSADGHDIKIFDPTKGTAEVIKTYSENN